MKALLYSMFLIWVVFRSDGQVRKIVVEPEEGEMFRRASYEYWMPEGVRKIKGIIVHQHGCGRPAEVMGSTGAYDLHWQELARKHDFALIAPYLSMDTDCSDWHDPENGTERAFLVALQEMAEESNHPELTEVPWVLWGHSGGATWSYRMFLKHGHKVITAFLRSGPHRLADTVDLFPEVPIVFNLGLAEKNHKQFGHIYEKTRNIFQYRKGLGYPVTWVTDPTQDHGNGKSRLIAIPFIDYYISERLSKSGNLVPLNNESIYGDLTSYELSQENGEHKTFLPNDRLGKIWQEFITNGSVTDTTPPPAPYALKAEIGDRSVRLTWQARADLESGIKTFKVYKNGEPLDEITWSIRNGKEGTQFQQTTYYDSPFFPNHQLEYVDWHVFEEGPVEYEVSAVNRSGLESERSKLLKVE